MLFKTNILSFFDYHLDECLPQALQSTTLTQTLLIPPPCPALIELNILTFSVSQSFSQHEFRFSDLQRTCALNSQSARGWCLEKQCIGAMQSELEVKIAVMIRLLLYLAHILEYLGIQFFIEQKTRRLG